MLLTCLRAVIFPDSCLLTVRIPLMFPARFPSVKAGFVLPLVRTSAKHQCILLPDTAPGQLKPCRLKRLSEIQSFRIRMEYIYGGIRFHVLFHVYKGCKKEFIKILIGHIVILNLSGSLFHIHVVGRIRKNHVCPSAFHQNVVVFGKNGIPAQNPVFSEKPHITFSGNARFLQFPFHIEVILFDLFVMDLIEQLLYLRRFKSRKPCIKIRILQILDQISKQFFVPCTRNFIQGNIQGLFLLLVKIHYRTGDFRITQSLCNRYPLMSANNRHVGIDHHGIRKPELLNGSSDFLVFLILRSQFLPRIIISRVQTAYRQHL